MWTIWDKKSNINNVTAERFFEKYPYLMKESVIYIRTIDNKIVEIEGKKILSDVYKIAFDLEDMEFINEYERILKQQKEEVINNGDSQTERQ